MFILAPVLVVSIGWQAIWWVGAIYALVMLFIYGSLVCQRPALQEDLPLSAESFQLDKTLANRDIWLLSLAFACFTLVMMSIGTYYPTYLNMTLGYTLGQAALISSIATIVLLISAPMAGWISDRIGSRRLIFSLPFLVIGLLCFFSVTCDWLAHSCFCHCTGVGWRGYSNSDSGRCTRSYAQTRAGGDGFGGRAGWAEFRPVVRPNCVWSACRSNRLGVCGLYAESGVPAWLCQRLVRQNPLKHGRVRYGAPGRIRTDNRLIRRRTRGESVQSIPYRWGI